MEALHAQLLQATICPLSPFLIAWFRQLRLSKILWEGSRIHYTSIKVLLSLWEAAVLS
jgi:hypothetical protein